MTRSFPLRRRIAVTFLAASLALPLAAAETKIPEHQIKFVSTRDILVEWKGAPGAAGHIVEWGTKPDDDFVPLGFFRPDISSYRHPDLMWETNHHYRMRAYYGPASAEVEISLPKELSDADYQRRFDAPEDYRWAGPKIRPDSVPVTKKSIRDAATAADAAPINFKITLQPITVSAFQLTWTDRASDEEGTMVELKKEGETEFQVVALVKPNVNAIGFAFEPPVRKGVLRLRPYYYGAPSRLLHLRTPDEPPEKPTAAQSSAAPKSSSS